MNKKSFKAGEIIFREGSKSESMFRIEKGEVDVIAKYGKADELKIATIKTDKYFGEMGVIDNAKRNATIVAKTDVDLLEIDKTSFQWFVENNPEDAIQIMQSLTKSLRETTKDYVEACKTISELMQDETTKTKKEGVWSKLKKFADVYNDIYATMDENEGFIPYTYGSHCMFY